MVFNMLENRTILVAGAAGLLGTKVVSELINNNAKVIAIDIDQERLANRLGYLDKKDSSSSIVLRALDLANASEIEQLLCDYPDISGAVNCSYPRNRNYGKHFFDVNIDDFNENVSLNLGSAFLLMQKCAAHFQKYKMAFSLVNISSIYGVVAPKFDVYNDTKMTMPVEYAAIKSALIHLGKYVVNYVGDSNFRVNCVSPGGLFDHQPEQFLARYKNHTLGKGMLDAEDMLGAIVFLLSNKSKYMNGQNLVIDDGFTI